MHIYSWAKKDCTDKVKKYLRLVVGVAGHQSGLAAPNVYQPAKDFNCCDLCPSCKLCPPPRHMNMINRFHCARTKPSFREMRDCRVRHPSTNISYPLTSLYFRRQVYTTPGAIYPCLGLPRASLGWTLGSTNGMNSARIEQMTEMLLSGSVLADRRALQRNLATFI